MVNDNSVGQEIAAGERCHLVRQAQLFHRALKGVHALAEFGEEIGVRSRRGVGGSGRLTGVRVVAADLAEEYLALHAEAAVACAARAGFDEAGDHSQLAGEA